MRNTSHIRVTLRHYCVGPRKNDEDPGQEEPGEEEQNTRNNNSTDQVFSDTRSVARSVTKCSGEPGSPVSREEILRICRKHGATNIRVFGSFARGEAGPGSDVDFLVDVDPEHSAFFPGGLLMDLEELLGRQVDIVEPGGLHWYIRDRVLEEAVSF